MNKKRKSYSRNANAGRTGFKFSKGLIITVSAAAGIVSLLGYAGIHSLIPVNGTVPVFAAPRKHLGIALSKLRIRSRRAIIS